MRSDGEILSQDANISNLETFHDENRCDDCSSMLSDAPSKRTFDVGRSSTPNAGFCAQNGPLWGNSKHLGCSNYAESRITHSILDGNDIPHRSSLPDRPIPSW